MASTAHGGMDRREVGRVLAGIAALAAGATVSNAVSAQTTADIAALNVLLNAEYLQAQFLSYIQSGGGLVPTLLTGAGTLGTVTPGRQVTIADAGLRSAIAEMAADQRLRLAPLRGLNGFLAVAQPTIDITSAPFSRVMRGAGVVDPNATFDPYASDENMLYALFFLKEASISAYRGVLASLSSRVALQYAAGAMATECQHAATLRAIIYRRGETASRYRENADRIAAFRRALTGGAEADRGASPSQRSYQGLQGTVSVTVANIVPADGNGEVPSRSIGQLLNILYLADRAVDQGGFFPNGVNGTLRTSAGL